MATLALVSIECLETQGSGADRTFITVNGARAWPVRGTYVEMHENDTEACDPYARIPGQPTAFDVSATITIWEWDSGSDHQKIDKHTAGHVERGKKMRVFQGNGSKYNLTYRVS